MIAELCPAYERERQMVRSGSQALAKALRFTMGLDWPCGHARTPETTHIVGEVASCKVCRRARWRAAFRRTALRFAAKAERQRMLAEMAGRRREASAEARQRKLEEITASFEGRLPLAELIFCVASAFDIAPADLRGPCRMRRCVHPRAVVARILHERGCSYPQIGKFLGGRDHSTVIHAIESWDIYARRDPRVMDAYRTYGDAA